VSHAVCTCQRPGNRGHLPGCACYAPRCAGCQRRIRVRPPSRPLSRELRIHGTTWRYVHGAREEFVAGLVGDEQFRGYPVDPSLADALLTAFLEWLEPDVVGTGAYNAVREASVAHPQMEPA